MNNKEKLENWMKSDIMKLINNITDVCTFMDIKEFKDMNDKVLMKDFMYRLYFVGFDYVYRKDISINNDLCIFYLILCMDWIYEIVDMCANILKSFNTYKCSHYNTSIDNADKYRKALRSIVVAHPLNTDRHKKFGLDGDLLCLDICRYSQIEKPSECKFRHMTLDEINGVYYEEYLNDSDYFIKAHSKDGMGKYIEAKKLNKLNNESSYLYVGFSLDNIDEAIKRKLSYFLSVIKEINKKYT